MARAEERKIPSGTVQAFKDAAGKTYFRARIPLPPDGKQRIWRRVPDEYGYSKARAKEYAAAQTEKAWLAGVIVPPPPPPPAPKGKIETSHEWFARYLELCTRRGQTTVKNKLSRWNKWIKPRVGHIAIVDITRDDVENVRDALDTAVAEYAANGKGKDTLSPKTAANVWSTLTAALDEARSSKDRTLRVRDDDPSDGVKPPETGGDKAKAYVHPREFLALMNAPRVPLEWRQLHALAAYTYTRPGELRVLTWDDVDLDGGVIRVTKAWDFENGKEKGTKTEHTRSVPIEPTLRPLLEHLRRGRAGSDLVAPLMSIVDEDLMAKTLRAHLRAAGVERAALYANSTTELPIRFRNWRDTGCTWQAIRGDDVTKTMRRAGHKNVATTMRYVNEAENASIAPADVFPPLPAVLVSKTASNEGGVILHLPKMNDESECAGGELNPYESYPTGT